MLEEKAQHLLSLFKKLKRDSKNGGAPHKPILLLAILQQIQEGIITQSKIFITPELILTFKDLWQKLVITQHQSNFALPFFHMRSEKFWELINFKNREIPITKSNSIKSLNGLSESVNYAQFNPAYFEVLLHPMYNQIIKEEILQQYFSETKVRLNQKEFSLINNLEMEILNDTKQIYQSKIDELKKTLSKEIFEEEIIVRGAVFKREIPKLYDFKCAISDLRIETTLGVQMIDACHIVPFSIQNDDTIKNGVALSPTIHRAFDRGLISINDNYEVILSKTFTEKSSTHNISQFEGKTIHLPKHKTYYPSIENLEWHRVNVLR
jgi:putative restriction endonuclease